MGVILYFRFLNIIFFHGWLSFLKEMELKESQKCKKNICFCPLGLLSVLFILFLSALRRVDLFLSRRECNTLLALSLLTFLCMYYMILLLMTDEYTELIFILLHFIYIHKYIYIKMFTIRFKFFFYFSEWSIEWRVGNPEMLQKGVNAICL